MHNNPATIHIQRTKKNVECCITRFSVPPSADHTSLAVKVVVCRSEGHGLVGSGQVGCRLQAQEGDVIGVGAATTVVIGMLEHGNHSLSLLPLQRRLSLHFICGTFPV